MARRACSCRRSPGNTAGPTRSSWIRPVSRRAWRAPPGGRERVSGHSRHRSSLSRRSLEPLAQLHLASDLDVPDGIDDLGAGSPLLGPDHDELADRLAWEELVARIVPQRLGNVPLAVPL